MSLYIFHFRGGIADTVNQRDFTQCYLVEICHFNLNRQKHLFPLQLIHLSVGDRSLLDLKLAKEARLAGQGASCLYLPDLGHKYGLLHLAVTLWYLGSRLRPHMSSKYFLTEPSSFTPKDFGRKFSPIYLAESCLTSVTICVVKKKSSKLSKTSCSTILQQRLNYLLIILVENMTKLLPHYKGTKND